MKRREVIGLIASAVALPFPTRAQKSSQGRHVGVLIPYPESDAESHVELGAFSEKLEQLGWKEGQNLRVTVIWTGGDFGRLQSKAEELVALDPDVIFVRSTAATRALQRETKRIPIVFSVVSDPVGDGFVSSMARPSGNITGFTNVEASLGGKWLEVLREISPGIVNVAVIFDPRTAAGGGEYYEQLIEMAAKSMGLKAKLAPVNDASTIETTIGTFAETPNGAMIVTPDATTTNYRHAIFSAAVRFRLPAVYSFRNFAKEGGLMSYGVDITDLFRQSATYVDRILRGGRAADLPVQSPIKFELVLNLKTAQVQGLRVPPSLLARADEVIE